MQPLGRGRLYCYIRPTIRRTCEVCQVAPYLSYKILTTK